MLSPPLTVLQPELVPNILLVDDNPDNLRTLDAILRRPGQNLVFAQTGDDAVKHLMEREFAVILMDVQMRGTDGLETISRIRSQEPTRDIPIILLAAFDQRQIDLFRGDWPGVVEFLFKPIAPEALRSKVAVFVELFRMTNQLKMQTELLREVARNERSEELASTMTEHERALIELATLKNQYELFLNSVGEGFYGLDHLGRITFVNPVGAQLLGLSVNELVNTSLHEIAHIKRADGPTHPSEQCPIQLTLADGVSRVENTLLRREDGWVSAVDYMVNPILTENRIAGAVVVAREQSRRPQRLERKEQSASSGLSRKQLTETKVTDLNVMVTDLDKLLRRLIGEDIEIVRVLSPALGRIRMDPSLIEQVIVNLVVGARDAMPRGGKLTIETGNPNLEEQLDFQRMGADPGAYVVLTVSDTGFGADSEPEARIFKPLFTPMEAEEAAGLALSTIYGIVTQSGGHIAVYNESDQGTTFKIFLPRHDENPIMPSNLEAETARKSKTILVVIDDAGIRDLVLETLQGAGYSVLAAAGADQARMMARNYKQPIHLLLSDVVMPRMRGPELAARLKRKYPEMRILFIASYTDNAVAERRLNVNAQLLHMPFGPQFLVGKVRHVLGDAE